jgi:hypothetical protein
MFERKNNAIEMLENIPFSTASPVCSICILRLCKTIDLSESEPG